MLPIKGVRAQFLPEWVRGEVRVVRCLPIQGYYGVPVVKEDVGATLDESHRRARHHLNLYAVVTVHHTADDLNLQEKHKPRSFGIIV